MEFVVAGAKPAYAVDEPIPLTWKLVNRTSAPWVVLSHMETGGRHFDAVTLTLDAGSGRPPLSFRLNAMRTAVSPVWVNLAPGSVLEWDFDLRQFAQLKNLTLGPGDYVLHAEYSAAPYLPALPLPPDPHGEPWTGTAVAPTVSFSISR